MSKEFEELVLKKLDNTDRIIQDVVLKKLDDTDRMIQDVVLKKLDDTDRTIQDVVLKKLNDTDRIIQDVVLKKLDDTDRTIQDVVKKLDDTDRTIQDVVKKLDDTDRMIQDVVLKKLDALEEKTSNTDKNVQELSAEFKNLNNKFTVFDYEINRKIDSLFDAFVVNTEKDSVHEEEIEALEEKFFSHDIRISNLENKILTA